MLTKTLLTLSIASSLLLPGVAQAKSQSKGKSSSTSEPAKVEAAPAADDSLMWFELEEGEVTAAKPKAPKAAPKRGLHLQIHTAGFGERAASTPTGACEGRCDKSKRKGFSMELLEKPEPQKQAPKRAKRRAAKKDGKKLARN